MAFSVGSRIRAIHGDLMGDFLETCNDDVFIGLIKINEVGELILQGLEVSHNSGLWYHFVMCE